MKPVRVNKLIIISHCCLLSCDTVQAWRWIQALRTPCLHVQGTDCTMSVLEDIDILNTSSNKTFKMSLSYLVILIYLTALVVQTVLRRMMG